MDLQGQFSDKEKAVIELLLQGKSNKQIASLLHVTVRTIEYHLTNIYNKLGVASRSEAILSMTKNLSVFRNDQADGNLRESTVASSPGAGNTVQAQTSTGRQPMGTTKFMIGAIRLLACIFIGYLILPRFIQNNLIAVKNTTTPRLSLVSSPSPVSTQPELLSEDQLALHSLVNFLTYLNQGEYEKASQLYGGSYSIMIDQNPEVDPDDHIALLKNACTINGMQCLQINSAGPTSAGPFGVNEDENRTEFKFQVDFAKKDGSLFVLGPCCGANATDSPPQSVFYFTVVKGSNEKFLVMDLPPYSP
jgi:DNA-binding CsgD family transcriptional regulator